MRTLFVLATLVILTAPALAQLEQHPDPRTRSARYDLAYSVLGRVIDADGNYAAKYPVTAEVIGRDGPVGKATTVLTNCFGDFDVYWGLYNVSDRWTVKLTTGGQSREQGVDPVHRRNDFAVQLDRSLPEPPESDPNCRGSWGHSKNRETFTGQLLKPTPPYKGPADNTLYAEPQNGVLVTLKWVKPDGTIQYPNIPLYTNEEGAYKHSFTNEVGGPPPAGYVLVWFADDPSQVTNVTLGDPMHYHVVSRPAARPPPPPNGAPDVGVVGALAAVAVALLAARRVRP